MLDYLPDFLVLGAQRSGTTHVFKVMCAHPRICVASRKETFFFIDDRQYQKGLEWYSQYYSRCELGQVKGELTPDYLFDPRVPVRIYENLGPAIKLVAILRNPISRTWSQYQRSLRNGKIIARFDRAIEVRPDLLERGLYARQLHRYYRLFPSEGILVLLYDDLKADALQFYRHLLTFLGVPDDLSGDQAAAVRLAMADRSINYGRAVRHRLLSSNIYAARRLKDITGRFENPYLDRFMDQFVRLQLRISQRFNLMNRKYEGIDAAARELMQKYFAEDIARLEVMLGRDLSMWQ